MTPQIVATFLILIWSSYLPVFAVPSGNHTCTGITKIPVTVLVNMTVPVTFRSYTWCLRVPPRCSKYTTQLRDRVQIHTEMHNKTITVCCRGYVEMEGRCVPACPEGADCPFMRCNRTNHCHCVPGYSGLYCNDPCPRGVWGKDCKRPCDCPPGYTCHHLTGDCFVDDRPARKTTTTTTVTTTKKATTTILPFTTEATTLETVKTPVFRFPPPPWVDAPSTPPKRLTTRVIRDDVTSPTTVNKLVQTTAPSVTKVDTVRPPDVDFLPPPIKSTTTTYLSEPKEIKTTIEVTQPLTIEELIIPTSKPVPTNRPKTEPTLVYMSTAENSETMMKTPTLGMSKAYITITSTTQKPLSLTPQQSTSTTTKTQTDPLVNGVITQRTPSTTTQQAPEPATQPTPVPTTQPTPVPTTQPTPLTTTQQTPVPTTQPTPLSTIQQIPFLTTQQTPSLTTQQTPPLTTQQTGSLTTQQTPSLTTQQIPLPTTQQTTLLITQQTPLPTTQHTLLSSNQTPFPTIQQTRSPTIQQTLSPTAQQALPSTTQQALPSTTQQTPPLTTFQATLTSAPQSTSTAPTLSTIAATTPPSEVITTVSQTTPATTLSPASLPTNHLQLSTMPIADTTKIIPLKEVVDEKTTMIPEFKVIKVIKTEQSISKVQKVPSLKYQTLPEQLSTTKLLPKTQSASIPVSLEPVATNFKTTLPQPSETKGKKEGSQIFYINPTFKDKTFDIGATTFNPSPKITQRTLIHVFTSPKDFTPLENDGNTIKNKVITKSTMEEKRTYPPNLVIKPSLHTTEHITKTIYYNDTTDGEAMKYAESVHNTTSIPEEQVTKIEISPKTFDTIKISTMNDGGDIQEITTQMPKKKSKDHITKKFEEKVLKKVIQLRTTTTLSPVHLLKQLLNVTSKPKLTTSSIEPTLGINFEEQTTVPIFQIEDNEDFDYKKSKFDDLAGLSSDKNKKKQEKIKQSKHNKESKESKSEKQGEIPIPPIVDVTSTTEVLYKNIIPDNNNVKNNLSAKVNFKEEIENHFSVEKSQVLNVQSTTQLPNNLWAALDPQVNNMDIGTTSLNGREFKEENRNSVQKSIINEVTEANGLMESNTIDTLHTPHDAEIRNGDLQKLDSNYSLIYNKMKLVKTDYLNPEPAYSGYAAMIVTLGIAIITLIALTGTLWLYLKRRREGPVMRPCIMAYELSEPPPLDIQNLEQTFFCPTFTNYYAEKINREFRELSYDHPRCSQPEPLYAEIRH